jgi:hypothetical protein
MSEINQFIIIMLNDGTWNFERYTDSKSYSEAIDGVNNWYLKGRIKDYSTNGVWASEMPDL